MKVASGVQRAGRRPHPGGRVIQLGVGERVGAVINAPHGQHLSIGQQGCRLTCAFIGHPASLRPLPGGWIVQLRNRDGAATATRAEPPRDQHLPVGQQGCCVSLMWGVQRVGFGDEAGSSRLNYK